MIPFPTLMIATMVFSCSSNDPTTGTELSRAIHRSWTEMESTYRRCRGKVCGSQRWLAIPENRGEAMMFDGMGATYHRLLHYLSYQRFAHLVRTAIWNSGPHSATALDLRNPREFGHYNPGFVQWVLDHGIPLICAPEARAAAQGSYDHVLKPAAQAFWKARQYVLRDRAVLEKMKLHVRKYMRIERRRVTCPTCRVRGQQTPSSTYYGIIQGIGNADVIGGSGIAFWVRRSIDGTDALWAEALRRVLETYDEDFLAQWPSPANDRDNGAHQPEIRHALPERSR